MSQNKLAVSEINIYPIKPKDGLIGFASLVFNSSLYVGGVAIHTTPSGGIRLVYPIKTLPNGLAISCVHPICREAGSAITEAVAKKMRELSSRCGDPTNENREPLERHQLHPIP